jgi:hypothetical protein
VVELACPSSGNVRGALPAEISKQQRRSSPCGYRVVQSVAAADKAPFGTFSLPLADWAIVIRLAFTVSPWNSPSGWNAGAGLVKWAEC